MKKNIALLLLKMGIFFGFFKNPEPIDWDILEQDNLWNWNWTSTSTEHPNDHEPIDWDILEQDNCWVWTSTSAEHLNNHESIDFVMVI